MKVAELLSDTKGLNVNRLELAKKSEGGMTLSKLLPTLDKMYELMKMSAESGINDYHKEIEELKAMKMLINDLFSNEGGKKWRIMKYLGIT